MTPWTFVHVADIQPGSPRSYRYNPSWIRNWLQARDQILAIDPELLLVGGDLTRDGSIHRFELEEARADLERCPFPCTSSPATWTPATSTRTKQGGIAARTSAPT